MNRFLSSAIQAGTVLLVACSSLFAQRVVSNTYGNMSGFGNVLFPGTGHPPDVRVNTNVNRPTFPGGFASRGPAPAVQHPSHSHRSVVAYPVFVGGYYGGGYSGFDTPPPATTYTDQPQYNQEQAPPPVVIINQAYRPETANPVLRDYSDVQLPEPRNYPPPPDPRERAAARAESERPTIFLIAFRDHNILPALAYWVEGDTLNYVTKEGQPNRISLSLVDRDFSRQLNKERSVEFALP